ncbi:MBL fold metallo-hydrolase [Halobaculum marinum]|uniref:MBL fold metallo-hydrolase n=1 Tax=Halobaculum marinum TaxID=3031996 RepID=A0ABD5X135_9EURY|nr:MBL fold metallo-hydrolase [Halobaculum sp. DT55]
MPRTSSYVFDVRFWDVDHGSAAYLRVGSKDVVLDCGANTQFSPLRWLNDSYYGLNTIDYLIISHPHQDHIADLDVMKELELLSSDTLLQRPKDATELVEENLDEAYEKGMEDYIEDAEFYLNRLDEFDTTPDLFPSNPEWALDNPYTTEARTDGGIPDQGATIHNFSADDIVGNDNYEKLNNLSRLTVFNSYGFTMVSAGDILQGGINQIKEDEEAMAAISDADVLVAPHHGRDSSFDSEFVRHINPDLVIFSDKTAEHTVSGKYGNLANGAAVENEQSGETRERFVVSTNSDGRIRIQANNHSDWTASVYGRDYASEKAASKRYKNSD